MLFESPRLYVRYFTMDDFDNFFLMDGDEEVMRYIRPPKNREDSAEFLQKIIIAYSAEKLNMRLALIERDTDRFVGSFGILPLPDSTEIQMGYSLLKEHWGKGYATEIVKAGLHYAFNELKLPYMLAATEIPNIASQNVLLKNGFVFEKEYLENGKPLYLYRKIKD